MSSGYEDKPESSTTSPEISDPSTTFADIDPSLPFIPHIGHAPPDHEHAVLNILDKVNALTGAVATIDARTARTEAKVLQLDQNLLGLSRMVARLPSGITLINAVAQILNKVNQL